MDRQSRIDPSGSIDIVINPPPAPKVSPGVNYRGAWVRAELDEGNLAVKVTGQASYAGRSITFSLDITDDLGPLKGALQQILDAYGPTVEHKTLAAAYEAHSVAVRREEIK